MNEVTSREVPEGSPVVIKQGSQGSRATGSAGDIAVPGAVKSMGSALRLLAWCPVTLSWAALKGRWWISHRHVLPVPYRRDHIGNPSLIIF
jgi:hypothetical protein